MNILKSLNETGDTIVEVLVAIAVLSFVLAGAYSTSQFSLNTIRDSQNKITAVNIAQTQIELLKFWVNNDLNNLSTTNSFVISGSKFYMADNTGSGVTITPVDIPPSSPVQTNGIFTDYMKETHFDSNSGNYTFTVVVNWNDLNTNRQDNVTISYRMAVS